MWYIHDYYCDCHTFQPTHSLVRIDRRTRRYPSTTNAWANDMLTRAPPQGRGVQNEPRPSRSDPLVVFYLAWRFFNNLFACLRGETCRGVKQEGFNQSSRQVVAETKRCEGHGRHLLSDMKPLERRRLCPVHVQLPFAN